MYQTPVRIAGHFLDATLYRLSGLSAVGGGSRHGMGPAARPMVRVVVVPRCVRPRARSRSPQAHPSRVSCLDPLEQPTLGSVPIFFSLR